MKNDLLKEYDDVFSQSDTLQPMDGRPMKIHMKEDSELQAIYSPRQIPHAWKEEVKRELDEMVKKKIIAPLDDEPSEWCHPIVVVQKPQGGIRLCVDLSELNKSVQRPVYPTVSPKEAINSIAPD